MLLFNDKNNKTFNNLQLSAVSLIISVVLLFVCSKNSLIYPMNDYCDENNFFSITDAMFHGKVLYKDIFEHKGPFLFLFYSLIHILGNSYFTLYLFECIANALFVYFGTKTILLYDDNATKVRTFLYALCLEFCLCTATPFMMGGTPEELYLWMSSYGLYVTLRCLKRNQYYSNNELLFIGGLCGALFWTKYSLLGFYAGLALYVIGWNLAQKDLARLGKTVSLIIGGFTTTCIPTIIYCSLTQSFSDMVNVYFIGNILGKHGIWSYTQHFYHLSQIIYKDIVSFLLVIFGVFYAIRHEPKHIKLLFFATIIPAFLASCGLKVFWVYYPMPMLVFIPIGMIASKIVSTSWISKIIICSIVITLHLFASDTFGMYSPLIGDSINPIWLKEHIRVLTKAIVTLFLLYIAVTIQLDVCRFKYKRLVLYACLLTISTFAGLKVRDPYFFTEQLLPQKRFSKIIKQIDNANILVYGTIDHGFIKASKTYPQVKYFCGMDLVADDTETEQLAYISNNVVDFIITLIKPQEMYKIINGSSYQLIDVAEPYHFNGNTMVFYLYQKAENKENKHE